MKKAIMFLRATLLIATFSVISFGQSAEQKKENTAGAAPTNPLLVDARQSGTWTVGIDPAKNVVKLTNTAADPLAVSVVPNGPQRKPFQFRASVNVAVGGTQETVNLPIPAGKRLVIENVSAVGRTSDGVRMELQYFTYFDNGDGIGDLNDITFHRISLVDQGTFVGYSTSTANHKVLVFADELIGSAHFSIGVQVKLSAPATIASQGQVTFSGYVEDLPANP